jgi:hypothetical protein
MFHRFAPNANSIPPDVQISGLNKKGPKWQHPGYIVNTPIIPHGISVALTGPAVFQYTAPASPDRHKEALAIFLRTTVHDPRVMRLADADVGAALFDAIASFLDGLGVPRGLKVRKCCLRVLQWYVCSWTFYTGRWLWQK